MRTVFALGALMVLSGCHSNDTPEVNAWGDKTAPAVRSAPKDSAGYTAEETRIRSLSLRTHLSTKEVITLLGIPDETSSSTYGANTGSPWSGTEWIYKWPFRRLSLVFQTDDSARELRLRDLEGFMKWADANKDGVPAAPGAPAYSPEQIAARRAELQPELDHLRGARLSGEEYLVVNSWSWRDF